MREPLEHEHFPTVKESPWMTQMYEANLWINYNEGKNFSSSVIHYDMNHQMMCVYDGEKEWITWETQEQIDFIPTWSGYYKKELGRPSDGSDDSPIDPERVDLKRFPQFAKARWTNTTMRAGDCMYLPAFHMHYVRSTGRNIAGMYMFQTSEQYDASRCKGAPTTGVPLARYDLLWDFPGKKDEAGYNMVSMSERAVRSREL
jgi:lysine-specific demethylase 8